MANPLWLAVDLSGITFTASNTDANYPLTNLVTYYASDQWRSNSVATNQTVNIDLGVAKSCDTVVIENYNSFTGVGTVVLQYDSADNPAYTSPVTILTFSAIVGPQWLTFASLTKRYFRILFGSGLTTNPQMGNWFLGARFDWGFPYDNPYTLANRDYKTTEAIALDGRIRTSQPYAGRQKFDLSFSNINDTIKANFRTLFQVTRGKLRPFYFLDTDGTTLYYVHFDLDTDPMLVKRYQINDFKKVMLKTQLTS